MKLNQRFVIGFCPLAIAIVAALLLSVAPPARAQFFSHSGSVGTFPFNFFPIDGAVSFYDISGDRSGLTWIARHLNSDRPFVRGVDRYTFVVQRVEAPAALTV